MHHRSKSNRANGRLLAATTLAQESFEQRTIPERTALCQKMCSWTFRQVQMSIQMDRLITCSSVRMCTWVVRYSSETIARQISLSIPTAAKIRNFPCNQLSTLNQSCFSSAILKFFKLRQVNWSNGTWWNRHHQVIRTQRALPPFGNKLWTMRITFKSGRLSPLWFPPWVVVSHSYTASPFCKPHWLQTPPLSHLCDVSQSSCCVPVKMCPFSLPG